MAANRIRADYSELMKISGSFRQEAESCSAMLQTILRAMEALRGGDWVGQGARAFYAEMDGQVVPALRRLIQALEQAAEMCRKLAELFKKAEDEAAAQLKQQGGGGGGGAPQSGLPSSTDTGAGGGGGGGSDNVGSGGGGGQRGGAGAPDAVNVTGDSQPQAGG